MWSSLALKPELARRLEQAHILSFFRIDWMLFSCLPLPFKPLLSLESRPTNMTVVYGAYLVH